MEDEILFLVGTIIILLFMSLTLSTMFMSILIYLSVALSFLYVIPIIRRVVFG